MLRCCWASPPACCCPVAAAATAAALRVACHWRCCCCCYCSPRSCCCCCCFHPQTGPQGSHHQRRLEAASQETASGAAGAAAKALLRVEGSAAPGRRCCCRRPLAAAFVLEQGYPWLHQAAGKAPCTPGCCSPVAAAARKVLRSCLAGNTSQDVSVKDFFCFEQRMKATGTRKQKAFEAAAACTLSSFCSFDAAKETQIHNKRLLHYSLWRQSPRHPLTAATSNHLSHTQLPVPPALLPEGLPFPPTRTNTQNHAWPPRHNTTTPTTRLADTGARVLATLPLLHGEGRQRTKTQMGIIGRFQ